MACYRTTEVTDITDFVSIACSLCSLSVTMLLCSRIALITRINSRVLPHHGGDGYNGFCEHCMLILQLVRNDCCYSSQIALITRISSCVLLHHGGDGYNGFCEHCMLTLQLWLNCCIILVCVFGYVLVTGRWRSEHAMLTKSVRSVTSVVRKPLCGKSVLSV